MRAIEIALTGLVGIVPPASVHKFHEVSVHFLKKAILRREGHSTFLERPGMCTISSLPNVEGLQVQRRTPMASPSRTCTTVCSLISETLFLVICSQDPNLHLPTSSNLPYPWSAQKLHPWKFLKPARTWALKSYFQSLIHLKSLWKGLRFIIC